MNQIFKIGLILWQPSNQKVLSKNPFRMFILVQNVLNLTCQNMKYHNCHHTTAGWIREYMALIFMGICNGRKNSLWWNDATIGGCPSTSDRRWCFLRLTDLAKAYSTLYYDDCFFSNRFSLGAHPMAAICHSLKIWQLSQ